MKIAIGLEYPQSLRAGVSVLVEEMIQGVARVHLDIVLNLASKLPSSRGCGGRLPRPSSGGVPARSRTGRTV